MPFFRSASFLLLSLLLVLPACGSDKKNPADGGETDSGQDGGGSEKDSGNKPGDAGKDSGSDAGKDAGGDASADASTDGSVFGMTDITVTATVKVEGAAAAVGVKVNTLSVDGELLATGTTDGTGTVTLGVQSNKYNFIHVEGTGTEFGAVVVQDPRNSNYTVDGGIATEKRNLFEGNLADLTTPVTYDNQKGNFVVGFTLDMATMSGMGASLANVTHDQVFILDHDAVND
ncbi:MAG: hypothetical protein KC416_16795, partial [Myxococcales bacterium]|nr:hypothetical protein [Myxococcales bacterium]